MPARPSNQSTSKVWRFYSANGVDHCGRTLQQILRWDDDALERKHDFIQWLFPLPEPSGANIFAPLLNFEEMRNFRGSPEVQAKVLEALRRMLTFYGFEMREVENALAVTRATDYRVRSQNWITPSNHNFLRLTRILKSLRLLGLPKHAEALFQSLEEVFRENRAVIGSQTFEYWRHAVQDDLPSM
jgi:hypothetical protein